MKLKGKNELKQLFCLFMAAVVGFTVYVVLPYLTACVFALYQNDMLGEGVTILD